MSYEHGDSRRVDGRRRLWRFVLLFFFLSHSFFTIIDCFYFFARDFWFDLKQKLKSYHLYLLWFNFWVLFIYLFFFFRNFRRYPWRMFKVRTNSKFTNTTTFNRPSSTWSRKGMKFFVFLWTFFWILVFWIFGAR